jgi:small-conductance mechanosensitive channel
MEFSFYLVIIIILLNIVVSLPCTVTSLLSNYIGWFTNFNIHIAAIAVINRSSNQLLLPYNHLGMPDNLVVQVIPFGYFIYHLSY